MKNRNMAIKHAKAKKEAMKEVMNRSYDEMESNFFKCSSTLWNIGYVPYSILPTKIRRF